MINPLPPFHSDVTIVVEDSCNCSCYPCRRLKSPDNNSRDRDDEKIETVSESIFQRLLTYVFRR